MARKRIGELLIDAGVLSKSQLNAALMEQKRWGGQLGRILVDMRMIAEETLVAVLSKQLNLPTINLDRVDVDFEVLELVDGDLAEQHSLVPFRLDGKFLDVAMAHPTSLGILDELRIRTQLNVRPYLCGPKMIERSIARLYNRGTGRFSVGFNPGDRVGPATQDEIDIDIATDPVTVPAVHDDPFAPPGAVMAGPAMQAQEIQALQARISHLEGLVARDEDVLRKLLALLVEKGVASREEILERIK